MLEYSELNFSKVNMGAWLTRTTAHAFLDEIKHYWNTYASLPLHPLYRKAVPIDGGFRDVHVALLHYFLENKKFDSTSRVEFFIERTLMYLEVDPPSEFIDRQGLLFNHLTDEDKRGLVDKLVHPLLIANLNEVVTLLSKESKLWEQELDVLYDQQERRNQYESLFFITPRNSKQDILRIKREKLEKFSDTDQNGLKLAFLTLADRYLKKTSVSSDEEPVQVIELISELRINISNPLLRQTLLCFAIECEALDVVQAISNESTVDVPDKTGRYPIHYAVKSGRYEIFEHLLKTHAKLNVVDKDGWTPLHYAIRYLYDEKDIQLKQERQAILETLLNQSDLTVMIACDRKERTALDYAVGFQFPDVAEQLRESILALKPDQRMVENKVEVQFYSYGAHHQSEQENNKAVSRLTDSAINHNHSSASSRQPTANFSDNLLNAKSIHPSIRSTVDKDDTISHDKKLEAENKTLKLRVETLEQTLEHEVKCKNKLEKELQIKTKEKCKLENEITAVKKENQRLQKKPLVLENKKLREEVRQLKTDVEIIKQREDTTQQTLVTILRALSDSKIPVSLPPTNDNFPPAASMPSSDHPSFPQNPSGRILGQSMGRVFRVDKIRSFRLRNKIDNAEISESQDQSNCNII